MGNGKKRIVKRRKRETREQQEEDDEDEDKVEKRSNILPLIISSNLS